MLAWRMEMELPEGKFFVAQLQCLHVFCRGCLDGFSVILNGIVQRLVMECSAIVCVCLHGRQINRRLVLAGFAGGIHRADIAPVFRAVFAAIRPRRWRRFGKGNGRDRCGADCSQYG